MDLLLTGVLCFSVVTHICNIIYISRLSQDIEIKDLMLKSWKWDFDKLCQDNRKMFKIMNSCDNCKHKLKFDDKGNVK